MVFTKDFVRDFYKVIQTDRVLVLVNSDVDAICAARIIQCLFSWDHVIHTIVPINGKQELETAYMENIEGVKYVLFINCGGCTDLVDILQPDPEVVFFILDSHRPLCVENIYNAVQTRIVLRQEHLDSDIPEYEQIFRDDESDSEDGSGSEDEEGGKKRRFDAEYLEKRQEKREWQQRRLEVLSRYMSTSHTGASAALTMYTVAFTMSQDTVDMLWWAIIGVTSQYVFHKVDHDHYFDNIGVLQGHVSRISKRFDDIEGDYSMNSLRISFDNDLMADLYRHWNLYDSLCQSIYSASHFKVWTLKGKSRFHEFLAVMGLPLTQCKQKFSSMDVALKGEVKSLIAEHCEKFSLDTNYLFIPTFVASSGYRNKVSAVDGALVCATMLEDTHKADSMDRFLTAMDTLHRGNTELFEKSIVQAIKLQSILMAQVQFMLSTNAVTPATSFLYAMINEGSPEGAFFRSPIMLERLAYFTLEAFITSEKCSKKKKELPLVMLCPLGVSDDFTLIVGIPPMDTIKTDNCRNIFGEVFKQVQQNVQCRTLHDHVDSHVIKLKKDDLEIFLEGLLDVLES